MENHPILPPPPVKMWKIPHFFFFFFLNTSLTCTYIYSCILTQQRKLPWSLWCSISISWTDLVISRWLDEGLSENSLCLIYNNSPVEWVFLLYQHATQSHSVLLSSWNTARAGLLPHTDSACYSILCPSLTVWQSDTVDRHIINIIISFPPMAFIW